MMMKKNILSRIKAAVIGAAMMATTFVTPAFSSVTTVTAATKEVSSLPYTLTADGVEDGGRQANFALTGAQKTAKTLKLNFTTDSKENATIAVYGFGLSADPYWENFEQEAKSGGKSSFSMVVDVPTAIQGKITKIGVGVWYPKDNSKWTLKSIEANGTADPDITEPEIPGTENDKSGTYSFEDNKDGTATISATLSAQYTENGETQFDYLLTKGIDEEQYAPYKDADGNTLPAWKEGDLINSHKFSLKNFGIDDISNVKLQSFEFAVKSDDYDMSTIQYGGGINVKMNSPADTEYVKGKNGYWYNDQGTEDMEKYGSEFKIDDVHGGYEANGCGGYSKLTWDVPKGVQPYVDYSNGSAAVGFQYWWGKDDTKTSTGEDGEEMNFAEIPEIHLLSCTATYTRTMTVPYNKTVAGPKNIKLTSGAEATNQTKLKLADLKLGERDKISAVKFSFKSAEALTQFVGGVGISVDSVKASGSANVEDGWYQPGNIAVINTNGTFDVMWILPETIAQSVYHSDEEVSSTLIGYWYGDKDGTEVKDITVTSVDYYVYESQESDIVIKGEDGIKVPDEITLKVGETYDIDVNIPNSTFESDMESVATVDENGTITAIGEGTATIKVTTPEGQEATIKVKVEAAVTTPKTTTSTITTTTSTVKTTVSTQSSTTVDPDSVIDWTKVLYGDVNVDGKVNVADVTYLAKHFIIEKTYPFINATAKENSDVEYDSEINKIDLSKLIEHCLGAVDLMDLGPADKSDIPYYKNN